MASSTVAGSGVGLTPRQKAAVLMISMGPELSSEILKHLKEEEIEELTLEIAAVRHVAPERSEEVWQELEEIVQAQNFIRQGGIAYAREMLEKALGPRRAEDILTKLTASLQVRPFDFVRRADPAQLLNFLQGEHPQTIALVLAYLNTEQAAAILATLPPESQADVVRRVAIMDRTSPEIVKEVEHVLERKLSSLMSQGSTRAGGIDAVVAFLNKVDRGTEKSIVESLEVQDPDLAEEIKKRMFVFEDVIYLDDRSMQRVLREVDMTNDMPLALKVASEEVKAKVFKNISAHAAENLRDSISYLGPVRLRDVEEAQQRIVTVIRTLEEAGEVIISRGGEDELIV